MDNDGRYRIPRSALRGILRKDLNFAFGGSGCNTELGKDRPCECPVCMVMKNITVMDTKSDYREPLDIPPDIRHRIKRNQYSGVVNEGSLFDMEVGPEGITFPFVMRYRGEGDNPPPELTDVIHMWQDETAFFGGSGSTGKGRFSLNDLTVYKWEICKKDDNNNFIALESYISNCGLKRLIEEKAIHPSPEKAEIEVSQYQGLQDIGLPAKSPNYRPRWIPVEYCIEIQSPLLPGDPIEALLDEGNHDLVVFQKRVWDGTETKKKVSFKGETARGVVRTAFGKIHTYKEDGVVKGLFEIEHEDCTCPMCSVFGNEHEIGKIRFEDLLPSHSNKKHMDHVSIDRFTGGNIQKFDDYPLAGSPDNPLYLTGRFWLRHDITDEEKEKLSLALSDVLDGLYPLGSKGSIGYGWVKDLKLIDAPEGIEIPEKPGYESPVQSVEVTKLYEFPKLPELALDEKAIYWPHYFLPPAKEVNREQRMIGHEKLHDKLFTGKIICSLETLTPLIIPDTENDNAFGLQHNYKDHRNHRFFNINNEDLIPGSEIRGPVSNIFEAITNSCFRVFEEKRYITRRIGAGEAGSKEFFPGIIRKIDGELFIYETKCVRLPLYDDPDTANKITCELIESFCDDERHAERIKEIIEKNKKVAELACENRQYLPGKDDKDRILNGIISVKFNINDSKDLSDPTSLAVLKDDGTQTGYIKFTGLNMVNQANSKYTNRDYPFNDDEGVDSLEILLNSWPFDTANVKTKEYFMKKLLRLAPNKPDDKGEAYKYPRTFLNFIKDNKEYTIHKHCERIFLEPKKYAVCYEIPKKVKSQYRDIIRDNKNNYSRIDPKLLTKVRHEELEDGDLVYFSYNNGKVTAVTPVPISRKTDPEPLGMRFKHNSEDLRPCDRVILLEDFDMDSLSGFSEKMLFRRHENGLCPACRIFGTTSYKGRVRFGFAKPEGNLQWLMHNAKNGKGNHLTLELLEKPRPTWSVAANNMDSKVPGRSIKIHHNGWKKIVEGNNNGAIRPTSNNSSEQPVAIGNKFVFEVYFENLHAWELGLLVYSLELESYPDKKIKVAHKIGKAKSFGFGSVKIDVKNILIRQAPAVWADATLCKGEYLAKGFEELQKWFNSKAWYEVDHIKKLRMLLQFTEKHEKIIAKFPSLSQKIDKGKYPGYMELKKQNDFNDSNRHNSLTTPYKPWHNTDAQVAAEKNPTGSRLQDKKTHVATGSTFSVRDRNAGSRKTSHSDKYRGVVTSFDTKENKGFIKTDNGISIVVLGDFIPKGIVLKPGVKVSFSIGTIDKGKDKGKLVAKDIEIIKTNR